MPFSRSSPNRNPQPLPESGSGWGFPVSSPYQLPAPNPVLEGMGNPSLYPTSPDNTPADTSPQPIASQSLRPLRLSNPLFPSIGTGFLSTPKMVTITSGYSGNSKTGNSGNSKSWLPYRTTPTPSLYIHACACDRTFETVSPDPHPRVCRASTRGFFELAQSQIFGLFWLSNPKLESLSHLGQAQHSSI
jgi:hypothetical protein